MNEMKDPRRSAAGKPRLLENPEVATKSPSPPPKGGGDEILHPGSSFKNGTIDKCKWSHDVAGCATPTTSRVQINRE